MKSLISILFIVNLLFGYQKGDTISSNIVKKLALQKDKIYIIDFFASWCESCKKELPLLIKVSKEIDRDKFELIGVDVDEDIKKAEEFQRELNIPFRVVNDPKNKIIEVFNPLGMPSLYLVKDGKVLNFLFGAVNDIDKVILDELREQSK